jgi:hypothetical protein
MGGILGNGRLVVASHSRGRLVCSNDNTLSAFDTQAVLTVFPHEVMLTQGIWCFEVTVVATDGGVACAGFDYSEQISHSTTGTNANAALSMTISDVSQPADVFRFILNISTSTMTVLHKKPSSDETHSFVFTCATAGSRPLCPFVAFQHPFKLRFNLGHQPFSSVFIGSNPLAPSMHSIAHFIRTSIERDFVRSCAPFGRYSCI